MDTPILQVQGQRSVVAELVPSNQLPEEERRR